MLRFVDARSIRSGGVVAIAVAVLLSASCSLIRGNGGRSAFVAANVTSVDGDRMCVKGAAASRCFARSLLQVPAGAQPAVGDCVQVELNENDSSEVRSASWTSHCSTVAPALGVVRDGQAIKVLIPPCASTFRLLSIENSQRTEVWKIVRKGGQADVTEVRVGEVPSGFEELVHWGGVLPTGSVAVYLEQPGSASLPQGTVTFDAGTLGQGVWSAGRSFPTAQDYLASHPCGG